MFTEPTSRQPWRRLALAAAPAALAVLMFGAGHAAAIGEAKYGTAAVIDGETGRQTMVGGEPHVCSFYFEFDMNVSADILGWKVKEWNAAPFDGPTVLKGQGGPTDADGKLRVPESGSLTLPNGRYNVLWDDEYPVDGSAGVQSFVVDCKPKAIATPTPTATPATPTPTPTPTEEAIGGTSPTGSVLDLAAAGGGGITPPPTDTSSPAASHDNDFGTLAAAAIAILAVLVGALAVMPRRVLRGGSRRS